MRELLIDPFLDSMFPERLSGIAEDNFSEAKRTNGDVLKVFAMIQGALTYFYLDSLLGIDFLTLSAEFTTGIEWWQLVYPAFGWFLWFVNFFWRMGRASRLAKTADMTQLFIYIYEGIMAFGLTFAILLQQPDIDAKFGEWFSFDFSLNASEMILMFVLPSIQAFSFLNLAETAALV